jgi:hypothetical protein
MINIGFRVNTINRVMNNRVMEKQKWAARKAAICYE